MLPLAFSRRNAGETVVILPSPSLAYETAHLERTAIANYSDIVERSANVGAVLRAHNETRINAFAYADTRQHARTYAKMRGDVERNIRLITNLITPGFVAGYCEAATSK